jgi:hypothetical protein
LLKTGTEPIFDMPPADKTAMQEAKQ